MLGRVLREQLDKPVDINDVNIKAPAKLTLSLRVTGTRSDGYHLIDAEMVSLMLHDVVTIEPTTDESSLSVSGPYANGVPTDASNLVLRALTLVHRRARVHIQKNIPHGGGLGGGSSDAAAILRWAGFTDFERASHLGADIPFCMMGGRARVEGIGEIITPLPNIHGQQDDITLIIPPFGVSTPAVYKAWDALGEPHVDATHTGRLGLNDLEPAALHVEPRLEIWREKIADAAGCTPTLAGSGATWFLRGSFPRLAELLPDAAVICTQTEK